MIFTGSRLAVALFVEDMLMNLKTDWLSITITRQVRSGVYSVLIATDTLLVDTVKRQAAYFSLKLTSISTVNTPDG